jgi:maleylacetoacetate isomerase
MTQLALHGYYRSSCSARLRIALDLKNIEYQPVYVNLDKGEHLESEYKSINPSLSVPTLVIDGSWSIPQSMAALEYLEEAYPNSNPLLPAEPKLKAEIRTLMNIIIVDTQPPTNRKMTNRAKSLGVDPIEWSRTFTEVGLNAFEAVASTTAGQYCCGDTITLADVCLVPALWNAERFGVALDSYPTISRIYATLREHASFKRSHWQQQPDCPKELK